MKGKSPWDQGGVRAVELCQQINNSLTEAIEICPHPLLEAMQDITKMSIDGLVEKAQEIKGRQGEIGAVHAIFIEPDNLDKMSLAERYQLKAERTEELAAARDKFFMRSRLSGEDAKWARHCFKVTNSWSPHLLTFLEVPGMPSTNNGMEQEFGHIRTKLRRSTGRQNNHDFIHRHGEYIALTSTEETVEKLLNLISTVNYADYRKEQA